MMLLVGLLTGLLVMAVEAPVVNPPGEAFVKERTADDLYGQAVHAFYTADYATAEKLLDRVIGELKSPDPRAHFFLALTYYRQGKKDEAKAMFASAAKQELEVCEARDYSVSAALNRVQGHERLMVEKYRDDARKEFAAAKERGEVKRYGMPVTGPLKQSAAKFSPITIRPMRPFVTKANFGARSVDPFRKDFTDNDPHIIPFMPPTPVVE